MEKSSLPAATSLHNITALGDAIKSGVLAVGDIFLAPSAIPGLPGRTTFQCIEMSEAGPLLAVFYEGVKLCELKGRLSDKGEGLLVRA